MFTVSAPYSLIPNNANATLSGGERLADVHFRAYGFESFAGEIDCVTDVDCVEFGNDLYNVALREVVGTSYFSQTNTLYDDETGYLLSADKKTAVLVYGACLYIFDVYNGKDCHLTYLPESQNAILGVSDKIAKRLEYVSGLFDTLKALNTDLLGGILVLDYRTRTNTNMMKTTIFKGDYSKKELPSELLDLLQ